MAHNDPVEFCGTLKGETHLCYFVYDGKEEVPIPKSQVLSMEQITGGRDDYIFTVTFWIAKKKGII